MALLSLRAYDLGKSFAILKFLNRHFWRNNAETGPLILKQKMIEHFENGTREHFENGTRFEKKDHENGWKSFGSSWVAI